MRIFVINLDVDTERRQRLENRLAELGLDWTRVSAIDGNRLTSSHEALVDRDAQAARGLRISPGEIGCWLSHRLAHGMVAAEPGGMGLILEDDIHVREELPDVLEQLERGAAGDFDVVYLHRYKLRRRYIPALRFDGRRTLGFVRPVDSGTLAYVMTSKAAKYFVERVPRMIHIADHALYQTWHHGLVVSSIDPPVVFHRDEGWSSIAARSVPHPASIDSRRWLRRKRYQLHKKFHRRISFHRVLNSTSRTGCLSGLA